MALYLRPCFRASPAALVSTRWPRSRVPWLSTRHSELRSATCSCPLLTGVVPGPGPISLASRRTKSSTGRVSQLVPTEPNNHEENESRERMKRTNEENE
eukprot:scaffold84853_cov81-Phaeocystis_antarctica.AAC.1